MFTCVTKDIKNTYRLNRVLLLNVLESIKLGFVFKLNICASSFSVVISSSSCGLSPVFTLHLFFFLCITCASNLCLGGATLVFI